MTDINKLIKDYENVKNKKTKLLESDNYKKMQVIELIKEMLVISDVIFAEYENQASELKSKIDKKTAILDFIKKDEGESEFYKDIEYKIEIEDDKNDLDDILQYMKDEISDYNDDIETLKSNNEDFDDSVLDSIILKINAYDSICSRFEDNPAGDFTLPNGNNFMFT